MGGFVCRFCNSNSEGDNGFVSLEINLSNRKIIIYICETCCSRLVGHAIIRCEYCGNIWLKEDAGMGGNMWTVAHCSLCNHVQAARSRA